jgi:hypothetical protein
MQHKSKALTPGIEEANIQISEFYTRFKQGGCQNRSLRLLQGMPNYCNQQPIVQRIFPA